MTLPGGPPATGRGADTLETVSPTAAFDRLVEVAARLTGAQLGRFNQAPDHATPCGHVMRTGRPLLCPDIRADAGLADQWSSEIDLSGAYAGVPVRDAEGQCLGTLCVTREATHAWPQQTLATLSDIADLIARELRLVTQALASATRIAELESLESIVGASQNAFIGKRLDGTIIYWSVGAERLYGYTSQEAVGASITMLATSPAHAAEFNRMHAAIARGESIQHETVRRRRDGTVIDVDVAIHPLYDANGVIVAASTSAIDITARLSAQRAERRLARLLSEAQAISHLGSWERDIATGRTVWTDQMYVIFGLEPDAFTAGDASHFRALIHPDDYEAYEAMLDAVLCSGAPGEAECRIARADGTMATLHTRVHLIRSVDGDKLVGTTQDVTAQRAMERQLTESRDLFSGVLDAATGTLIVSTDADGMIRVFNAGAERMLGYRAADVVAKATLELFHAPAEVVARARGAGHPARVRGVRQSGPGGPCRDA